MRPYTKCPDCIISQDDCNSNRPPYPHCFKGEETMFTFDQVFHFGQIFKLTYPAGGEADYYILTTYGHNRFALVNLSWGSKMSTTRDYNREVTWTDLKNHAGYFITKGCKLVPLDDCFLEYTTKPEPVYVSATGSARIGRGAKGTISGVGRS